MIRTLKYLFIIFFLIAPVSFGGKPPSGNVSGIFMALGIGGRIPLGNFANTSNLGYGLNVEFSYTDLEYLPVFVFGSVGFEQYSGSQKLYQDTYYSNFQTTIVPVNIGAKYYFPPILEEFILLMPIVQASASYNYFQENHQFKIGSGVNNYLEKKSKFGFSVGTGLSIFLMDIVASYNFIPDNQFLSVDLKLRIPLYIKM
jgi:hypothetical protein